MENLSQLPGKRVRIYRCTVCDTVTERELLLAKKINFVGIGAGGKLVRSRTKHWMCPKCVSADEDWNLKDFKAPGNLQYEPEHIHG